MTGMIGVFGGEEEEATGAVRRRQSRSTIILSFKLQENKEVNFRSCDQDLACTSGAVLIIYRYTEGAPDCTGNDKRGRGCRKQTKIQSVLVLSFSINTIGASVSA